MHRCGSGPLLTLAIALVAAFTGCLGKSSPNSGNGGVKSISLTPGSQISIETGGTLGFSASATDALGHAILGVNIQFVVESGSPNAAAPLSVASNGSACAGNWDSTVTICSPGNPGIALVTAAANGVSSTATWVYVHKHVASMKVVTAETQPLQYDCFSQGQTWLFQGIAYDDSNPPVDITSSVGPMTWSSSNNGVVTATPYVNPLQTNVLNLVQTTAKTPGITQLFATVGETTSAPYPYTTCLIQSISLQIGSQGEAGNSITVNSGSGVSITATAVDTLYHVAIADNTALTNPPLTWSTTNPEVAAFTTTTNSTGSNSVTARANLGSASITASCTPPTCNIGVLPGLPIYASDGLLPNGTMGYGAISVNVTSTSKTPTYTAWAATTGCKDQAGCTSALFPVTPGTNPIGTIISLPRTPNSMMFTHASSPRVYFGSDQGLMYVDVTGTSPSVVQVSNSSTPCKVSLCGKVLTISNDGKLVVVADTVSVPSQVYIYNSGSTGTTPVDLIFDNPAFPGETATAAAFSPDQLKLFILTKFQAPAPAGTYIGNMYVYSTVDAFTLVPPLTPGNTATFATPANAVISSADGSFVYAAVQQPVPAAPPALPVPGFVSGFANCDTPATSVLTDVPIADPLALYPLPTLQLDSKGNPTEVVLALDTLIPPPPPPPPAVAPPPPPTTVDMFGVNVEQNPLLDGQFVCTPPSVGLDTHFPQTSVDLGQGNFTPIYSQLVNNGEEMIVVGQGIPAVLLFNVSNGTTSPVPLLGSPATGCPQCAGNSMPLAASASTDGSQVFVAACDQYDQTTKPPTCTAGSVHIVNTCGALACNVPPSLPQGDFQQVPYVDINNVNNPNMCNDQGTNAPLCLPNLIAIKPQ